MPQVVHAVFAKLGQIGAVRLPPLMVLYHWHSLRNQDACMPSMLIIIRDDLVAATLGSA